MNVIPMAPEHLDALAALERACFPRPWSREALAEELENPAACFLVAAEGDRVLGYGGMHCAAGECYVDNIAVDPACRRQGVGTALVTALREVARARGGEFLSLEVRPSNTGAVALYTGLGFQSVGRRKNFYTQPVEYALLLTLGLKEEEALC